MVDFVTEQTHPRWLSIETCTCLKGSRAQRSFARLFGRMGFSRSSWHSLRRGRFFFLRIDTSLLPAACWVMASGMRLAILVKFQCGEIRKFGWCCGILWEAGALCGSRFQSTESLEVSSVPEQSTRSWTSDIGLLKCHHQLLSIVPFYILNHTDSTETRCRFNVLWSLSVGRRCISLAYLFSQALSSAACAMMKLFTHPFDEPYDHSVAVHLPKPSLVSLPTVSVAKSFSVSIDASSARRNNAGSGGCRDGGRREETQTDSAQVGGWFSNAKQGDRIRSARKRGPPRGLENRSPAAFCKSTTQLMGIIIKQCLRTEQETRSLYGAIFDTIIMATEREVVKSMREETRRCNEGVQAADKGHALVPPQIWAWGGLIAGLQKQGAAVGAANAATLTGYLKQLDGMNVDTKCDHARFCRVDRTYQSEQAPITLSTARSGVRDPVVSAVQQLEVQHASTAEHHRPNCLANSNSGWTLHSTSRK